MPNVNDLKTSNFLTQKEVDPPILVTIASWEKVNVAKEGAEPEIRFALRFREQEKPMTLNVTNGNLIAVIVGSPEFDNWIGVKIVLYRDETIQFGGKIVGGIRVRAPINQAPPTQPSGPNPNYVGDNPKPPPNNGVPF